MPPKTSEPKGKGDKRPPDPGGTHPKTRAGSKQQTAPATATATVQPTQEAAAKSKGKEVAEVEVEDKRVKFVMKDGRVRLATSRD